MASAPVAQAYVTPKVGPWAPVRAASKAGQVCRSNNPPQAHRQSRVPGG